MHASCDSEYITTLYVSTKNLLTFEATLKSIFDKIEVNKHLDFDTPNFAPELSSYKNFIDVVLSKIVKC